MTPSLLGFWTQFHGVCARVYVGFPTSPSNSGHQQGVGLGLQSCPRVRSAVGMGCWARGEWGNATVKSDQESAQLGDWD